MQLILALLFSLIHFAPVFWDSHFPFTNAKYSISVLYEKRDRNDLGNYRPVSIQAVFFEAFKNNLHAMLSRFSDKINFLTPHPFGFRNEKSSELALLEQKYYILTQFENKSIVVEMFVKFSKAFDVVNSNILRNINELIWYSRTGLIAFKIIFI